jgi:hypothetical protein
MGVQLSDPAAAGAAMQGVGRAVAPDPPSKPAVAVLHDQQAVQQQQAVAAAGAADGKAGLGVLTPDEPLQLWLFDLPASPAVAVPLVYKKDLAKGGQAGVLLVEQPVQQEWHRA